MKKTMTDLQRRAEKAIDNREEVAYDVAGDFCQIVSNVAHMKWFLLEVMRRLSEDIKCYQHLEVPNEG